MMTTAETDSMTPICACNIKTIGERDRQRERERERADGENAMQPKNHVLKGELRAIFTLLLIAIPM